MNLVKSNSLPADDKVTVGTIRRCNDHHAVSSISYLAHVWQVLVMNALGTCLAGIHLFQETQSTCVPKGASYAASVTVLESVAHLAGFNDNFRYRSWFSPLSQMIVIVVGPSPFNW